VHAALTGVVAHGRQRHREMPFLAAVVARHRQAHNRLHRIARTRL
jgi:hypothetical protein